MTPGGARRLRRIPLKEEFVELTGDHVRALILAQWEYKYTSSRYVDAYIEEEVARARAVGQGVDLAPTQGWVSMDANALVQEMMLRIAATTMRRHMRGVVEPGWIMERHDPRTPWARTLQYRLDPIQLARDLWAIGHVLAGWHFPEEVRRLVYGETGLGKQTAKTQDADCKTQVRGADMQDRGCNLEDRKRQNAGSYIDDQISFSESVNQIDRSGGPRAPKGGDVSRVGEGARGPIDRPAPPQGDKNTADIRAEHLRRQVDQTDDSEVDNAAAALAVEIVRDMGCHAGAIDAAKLAKLAQVYVAHRQAHVLQRVAKRVAKTAQVRYPWHHLTYSLANEPEETNLSRRIRTQAEVAGSGQDGQRIPTIDAAARRREGYEWLFDLGGQRGGRMTDEANTEKNCPGEED